MRTNIELDDELVAEAMKLSGVTTKRELVDLALRELVRLRKKKDLSELSGRIRFYDGYDYKRLRRSPHDAD